MKKMLLVTVAACVLLLVACGSGSVPPDSSVSTMGALNLVADAGNESGVYVLTWFRVTPPHEGLTCWAAIWGNVAVSYCEECGE